MAPHFPHLQCLLLLLLLASVSSSSAFPPHSPAIISGRAMLVGQACQDVSAHSVLSFFFVFSVFLSFLLSSFFSLGQVREEFLGPWAPLAVLFPSATHLSLPGLRGKGVGGQAWIAHSHSLSFTLDWGGRRAGGEGGLPAGCALPGLIQHPLRLWSPHFLLPKAWSSQGEAAFDGASVPTTSLFRSTSRSCFSSFLFLLLSFFLPSCQSLFSSLPSAG